jgi:hypothetical protein
MNAELSRWVDDAMDIAASGRWAAFNDSVTQIGAHPGPDSAWRVKLFSSLCESVFSEYLLLKRAYEDSRPEASLLAWRARNLLELSVWCIYCSKSMQKARRFCVDAGWDVAAAQGTESLEHRYKSVSDAAIEIGMGNYFAARHKILSKFAHPTAMQILGPPDDAKMTKQQAIVFSHGCHYFVGAFTALEKLLDPGGTEGAT